MSYLIPLNTGEYAVAETSEIIRARQLPWRDWETNPDLPRMIELMTRWLQHTPAKCVPERCTCCRYVDSLNDAQAVFLSEFFALRRAVVPLRTGKGKTLAALLAGTILEKATGRYPKTVMIVPASGKEKTQIEATDYAMHWRVGPCNVVTYEFLANPKNLKWLEEQDFDLVLADEAHKLTEKSKVWGRLSKWMLVRAKAGRPVTFVPFTASMSGRKLSECWHYTRGAMGDASPLPRDRQEAKVWAAATDEKIPLESQVLPGALCSLAPRPEGDHGLRERAQMQLGARIAATPGFISTKEDIPPVTLKMTCTELQLPQHVQDMVNVLRRKKELPNGRTFTQAWDVWKHARRFGCGLYQDWDPPAPRAWLEARRAWYDFVDHYLTYHRDIDSHVHVINRIDRGQLPAGEALLAHWREIEPAFKPNSVAKWVDDTTLNYCADWLQRDENKRGICWVEFTAFGRRLAEMTGLPLFAEGATDRRTGKHLTLYTGTPMIVSVKHGQLFNLQWHNTNLLSTVLSMGKQLDQLIGRTVRNGQESPEVWVEFLMTVLESYSALDQCFRDARRAQRVDGQAQKLCYGECVDSVIAGIRG